MGVFQLPCRHQGLQGNLSSHIWSTSSPSSLAGLGACRAVPYIVSLVFLDAADILQVFSPLLKSVTPEALLPGLLGLDVSSNGSVLEPAGIAFVGHGGSFWHLAAGTAL